MNHDRLQRLKHLLDLVEKEDRRLLPGHLTPLT